MKKLAVVIGRFAPVHKYHIKSLLSRAAKYDHVIVLLGSAYKALNQKNPFMPRDREQMIRASLQDEGIDSKKFTFVALKDYPYSDNRWVLQVQKIVYQYQSKLRLEERVNWTYEPILVGVNKDDTTFYLKLFPQWKTDIIEPEFNGNATDIRKAMFENNLESVREILTPTTFEYIKLWMTQPMFTRLQREYEAEKRTRTCLAFVGSDGKPLKDEKGEVKVAPYKPLHTLLPPLGELR